MRTQRMVPTKATIITLDPSYKKQKTNYTINHYHNDESIVIEQIEGLIEVYKDGRVERPEIVPCVQAGATAIEQELGVTSMDIVIDNVTNITSRFYFPMNFPTKKLSFPAKKLSFPTKKLPLLVYFHGGGFCVGSTAWSCYHEFLTKLAALTCCLIMSVNYRLAPEHPLPAAYEDGLRSLVWLKQEARNQLWSKHCDFSRIFLMGDSAGANIAHNVSARLRCYVTKIQPLVIKGVILVQPFFGGEARTCSENSPDQPRRSVLNLAASDTYWRLALPAGSNRDHVWCNPLAQGSCFGSDDVAMMVCVSELDILKDRELEFCDEMVRIGRKIEACVYRGVGHAFQIVDRSMLAQTRCQEMMIDIKAFVEGN